jgi:CDP-diacylglycerol--glycerol-3-phosphate 3-phosphatidyltransferase
MLKLNSLPNLLCLLRILASPLLMGLILLNSATGYFWAAVLLILMAISDFIDGRLARHLQVVSPLGVFLDTISDKILVAGVLLPLVAQGILSGWVALIIIGREFIVSGLRSYAATQGEVISAGIWGKQKFTITMVALVWLLLAEWASHAGIVVAWDGGMVGIFFSLWIVPMAMAVIWTIFSAVDYLWKAWPLLRRGWTPRPRPSLEPDTDQ